MTDHRSNPQYYCNRILSVSHKFIEFNIFMQSVSFKSYYSNLLINTEISNNLKFLYDS